MSLNDLQIICAARSDSSSWTSKTIGLSTAATALCVVEHEACSNGRGTRKQTERSCGDRCRGSESALTHPNDLRAEHQTWPQTGQRIPPEDGCLLGTSCSSCWLLGNTKCQWWGKPGEALGSVRTLHKMRWKLFIVSLTHEIKALKHKHAL